MAALFPTVAVALLAFSLWSGSHFWRTIAVSWLATVSVGIYIYLDIEKVLSVERLWGYALFVTLLLWSVLLTPVQLLFFKAEDRKPTASIRIVWDPTHAAQKRRDIQADIVAIHGLGSNSETAWKHVASNNDWVKDFLSLDFPLCRIILVDHDSRWDAFSPVQSLRDYGQVILDSIASVRRDEEEHSRPLILVGHSFGGILLKKALVVGKEANPNTRQRLVANSTQAAIFFGTPHKGSNFALFGTLSSYFSYWRGSRTDLLEFLTPSSRELEDLHWSFLRAFDKLYMCNLFETIPHAAFGLPLYLVVGRDSAVIDGRESVPLDADHRGLNKFSSPADENYVRAKRAIQSSLDWVREKKVEEQERHAYAVPFRIRGIPVIGAFIGRTEMLEQMADQLLPVGEQRLRVLALQGLGGIGKSQLAIEYATRHQLEYTAIFWCSGRSRDTLRLDMARIAEQIPLHPVLDTSGCIGKDDAAVESALLGVLDWFSRPGNSRWLLIIDNCDRQQSDTHPERSQTDGQAYDVRAFFPSTHQGTILLTTRLSYLRQIGKGIDIGTVSPEDALKILCNASGGRQDDPDAKALAESLEGLPLALNQAGSFIAECGISPKKYLDLYQSQAKVMLARQPQLSSYSNGSIMTTWEISMEAVMKKGPLAGLLFQLWGFLDNYDFAYDILRTALESQNTLVDTGMPLPSPKLNGEMAESENDFQPVPSKADHATGWVTRLAEDELLFTTCIATLREFSLIQPKQDLDTFTIHPVVHEWTRQRLSQAHWNEYLTVAAVILGRCVSLGHWPKSWIARRRMWPHASHIYSLLKSTDQVLPEAAPGYHGLAIMYFDAGFYNEAGPLYESSARAWGELEGVESHSSLRSWHDRALPYRELGQFDKCRALWEWTLSTSLKVLDPGHLLILRGLDDLGRLATLEGDLDRAEDYLQRAFDGKIESLGAEDIITIDTERQMTIVAYKAGRLELAKQRGQHVLRIWERELGADHSWTLLSVADLAGIYLAEGHREEAEVFYHRAASGLEEVLGPAHQHTLQARVGLGKCYAALDRLHDAEAELSVAAEGLKRVRGMDHSQTEDVLQELAALIKRKAS